MDVLTFRWVPWLLNILFTKRDCCRFVIYVTCFYNLYALILIKYQLHFDFLVVFTLLLRPCQPLYHVSWLLKSAFFFCTNEWPLPVTTFFVFSKPFWSADRDSGIFCTAATTLFIAVKGLSTATLNSQNLLPLQPQPFYSSFVALLEVILLLQRCSFPTYYIWLILVWFERFLAPCVSKMTKLPLWPLKLMTLKEVIFRWNPDGCIYSRLLITRTLANSNLALTRTKIDFS